MGVYFNTYSGYLGITEDFLLETPCTSQLEGGLKKQTITPHANPMQNSFQKTSKPKVFFSYRRYDSASAAGRLFDHLVVRLGQSNIYKDVSSNVIGSFFKKDIKQAIEDCDFVLVIIGRFYCQVTNDQGNKRLFEPNDLVRLEIEFALQKRKQLIPVLVDGATMPNSKELPKSISQLVNINGLELRNERWKDDFNHFYKELEKRFAMRSNLLEPQGKPSFTIDVIFSFDNNSKPYVKEVAKYLNKNGLRVFLMDQVDPESNGNFYSDVISVLSKFCVVFISNDYLDSSSSQWVFSKALQRQEQSASRYLLPVVMKEASLKDLPIEGLGYLSAEENRPEELGEIINQVCQEKD